MKKIYLAVLSFLIVAGLHGASFTVTIVGTSYSPAALTVTLGDVVTILANTTHPLSEVAQTTWTANGTATLSTGWGTKTSDHTFTVTTANDIYYVCSAHVGMGMKGRISVINPNAINENSISFTNAIVFPNPVAEKLSITLTSAKSTEGTINLFSVTGQQVAELSTKQILAAGENIIELTIPASLSNGIYLLEISGDFKSVTKQILIAK